MNIQKKINRRVLNSTYIFLFFCLAFFSYNCNLKKPVAPQWDVQLNFPLVNRPYSIDSLIKKDPELFQINSQNGLISYSYAQNVISDSVGDKLNLKPNQPNPFLIDAGTIPYKDFYFSASFPNPGIPSGIIPAGNLPPFYINLPSTNQFDYLEFDSGKVKLIISNLSPIALEFLEPIIFRDGNGNLYSFDIGTVAPLSQKSSETSLKNKILSMPLSMDSANVRTPGSSAAVQMPDTILRIRLDFQNLYIRSARAKIPPTEILRINNSKFVIDTSANASKLKIAKFKKGLFSIKLINDFDVAAAVTFQLPQFYDRITRQIFNFYRIISRKDSFVVKINLSDYEFNSQNPTDTIYYNASIQQLGSEADTTEFRIFRSTDKLIVAIILQPPPDNQFVLSYIEGIIKPTIIDFDTTLKVKLGELPERFKFDSLKLPDSKFNFILNCPNIPLRLNGDILLADSSIYKISIPQTILNANTSNSITIGGNEVVSSLTNYISKNKNLPELFKINTTFLINPNYVSGSISSSDKVNGSVVFDIPFNLGIKKGIFRDTLILGNEKDENGNTVDVDSALFEKIQSGIINFNLINKIPIGIKFSIKLLDKDKKFVQYIPSSGPVVVNPAQVNIDGFSSTATQSKIAINMSKTDIDNFNKSEYAVVELEINSIPTLPSVKIRNIDVIQVKVFASFNYRLGNDD